MGKEIKQWITVNHIHIPIFEGESKADAVKRLKEGVKKGKNIRPISKKEYDKKEKAYDKAYKALGTHTERLSKAEDAIKAGDTSDKAKNERMNAERTLKEAGQRLVKREEEHKKNQNRPVYTSIKVNKGKKKEEPERLKKLREERNRAENDLLTTKQEVFHKISDKESYTPTHYAKSQLEDAEFRKNALEEMKRYENNWDFYDAKRRREISPEGIKGLRSRIKEIEDYEKNMKKQSTPVDHVQSKSSSTLADDLKAKGFELDSADRHTLENNKKFNDEKVTLFDKDKNEYEGTYNRYNDGGVEIVNIKKKEKSWQDKDEEAKQKQIAKSEAQKQERNSEPKYINPDEPQPDGYIENERRALKQYHEWEEASKKKYTEYDDSPEYRRLYWGSKEDRAQAEANKKQLETEWDKNKEEGYKVAEKLQKIGALPRYSQPRDDGKPGPGTILEDTVKKDPRYETLRNSLSYSKHHASDMLRHIMYAEEEGRTTFTDMVYDFYGGDRRDYTTVTATYKHKPGQEGYTNFGQFLNEYKKAYKAAGYKVVSSENRDSHRKGYRAVRGGYQSASHTQIRLLTLQKIEEKVKKNK